MPKPAPIALRRTKRGKADAEDDEADAEDDEAADGVFNVRCEGCDLMYPSASGTTSRCLDCRE